MRKIWVAIGAAGLALPGMAREGAGSPMKPVQVAVRSPAGGVLVAAGKVMHGDLQVHSDKASRSGAKAAGGGEDLPKETASPYAPKKSGTNAAGGGEDLPKETASPYAPNQKKPETGAVQKIRD